MSRHASPPIGLHETRDAYALEARSMRLVSCAMSISSLCPPQHETHRPRHMVGTTPSHTPHTYNRSNHHGRSPCIPIRAWHPYSCRLSCCPPGRVSRKRHDHPLPVNVCSPISGISPSRRI